MGTIWLIHCTTPRQLWTEDGRAWVGPYRITSTSAMSSLIWAVRRHPPGSQNVANYDGSWGGLGGTAVDMPILMSVLASPETKPPEGRKAPGKAEKQSKGWGDLLLGKALVSLA